MSKLDPYHLQIVVYYFKFKSDFLNVIQVRKQYQNILDRFRINPIPITKHTKNLFQCLDTQQFFTGKNEIELPDTKILQYNNEISYSQYLKMKEKNKNKQKIFKALTYTKEDRKKFGDVIPEGIKILGKGCFEESEITRIQIPNTVTKIDCYCFYGCEFLKNVHLDHLSLGDGKVNLQVQLKDDLFYQILSETTGLIIENDRQLLSLIQDLSIAKRHYDQLKNAYSDAMNRGYGIVNPLMEELNLQAPVIVRQGSKYGVKIKAKAPSIHLIRTDVETEINPFVGTQQQSEDFVNFLKSEMEKDPDQVWDLEIFGKTLFDLVHEGLHNKLVKMPAEAQLKLQHTLERIINEGRGNLICIIL